MQKKFCFLLCLLMAGVCLFAGCAAKTVTLTFQNGIYSNEKEGYRLKEAVNYIATAYSEKPTASFGDVETTGFYLYAVPGLSRMDYLCKDSLVLYCSEDAALPSLEHDGVEAIIIRDGNRNNRSAEEKDSVDAIVEIVTKGVPMEKSPRRSEVQKTFELHFVFSGQPLIRYVMEYWSYGDGTGLIYDVATGKGYLAGSIVENAFVTEK